MPPQRSYNPLPSGKRNKGPRPTNFTGGRAQPDSWRSKHTRPSHKRRPQPQPAPARPRSEAEISAFMDWLGVVENHDLKPDDVVKTQNRQGLKRFEPGDVIEPGGMVEDIAGDPTLRPAERPTTQDTQIESTTVQASHPQSSVDGFQRQDGFVSFEVEESPAAAGPSNTWPIPKPTHERINNDRQTRYREESPPMAHHQSRSKRRKTESSDYASGSGSRISHDPRSCSCYRFGFGKYNGYTVCNPMIEDTYLRMLRNNKDVTSRHLGLKESLQQEFERRQDCEQRQQQDWDGEALETDDSRSHISEATASSSDGEIQSSSPPPVTRTRTRTRTDTRSSQPRALFPIFNQPTSTPRRYAPGRHPRDFVFWDKKKGQQSKYAGRRFEDIMQTDPEYLKMFANNAAVLDKHRGFREAYRHYFPDWDLAPEGGAG
ncbi:hypothetical protein BDV95DRAFT_570092 [Massariosphaeria phaeospora]|uniref:Uncharacterized protein n=1 Tax=Massariosphaeria phaeospora TaxID=100035 RepID=A0A7C8IGT2_9PLEO|nr:hypothetical protein BDV95DRAFT_570092 [Massariosphaeria phaeospora]